LKKIKILHPKKHSIFYSYGWLRNAVSSSGEKSAIDTADEW